MITPFKNNLLTALELTEVCTGVTWCSQQGYISWNMHLMGSFSPVCLFLPYKGESQATIQIYFCSISISLDFFSLSINFS